MTKKYSGFLLCLLCVLMLNVNVSAKEYTIRPGVSIQELYSDNVNLSPKGQEEGAFVTEVSPFVSLSARGARNRINATVRAENIFFHGIDRDSSTFFQGQLDSRSRLWANSFFLDLRGTHTQANSSNKGRVAIDNISQTGGRVDVSTYTISPFWRMQLGGYAQGEARVSYSDVMINNNDDDTGNDVSDSRVHEEKFTLNSSHRFDTLSWKLGLSNRQENRTSNDAEDIHYFNAFGEVGFRLMQRFLLFARVGYTDNDLGTTQLNSENGVFYQIGGRWKPSSAFEISAAGGNNSFIKLSMAPFRRAQWDLGFRHNNIGLNTGSQWETNFEYNTNHFLWHAGYAVDTVTTQQVLLERDVFESGFRNPDNSDGVSVNNSLDELTSLRNEVYERKRGEISVEGTAGRNILRLTGYVEKRNYDGARQNEDATGANFSWQWRFNSRTSSVITADLEEIDGGSLSLAGNEKNTRWGVGAQVRRAIMKYLTATIGYRYSRQEANQPDSEYRENRIFARINFLYR
jgi:uncharacterized protein (PEP-CTERM system associated)